MNITITIPDAVAPKVVQAIGELNGYQATLPDPNDPTKTIANPENPNEFARRHLREYVKHVYTSWEAGTAGAAAAGKAGGDFG